MKKAILYVSPEVLRDALNIPDGIEIVAIDYMGSDVAFMLSGDSLPDTERGCVLPMASVIIHREYIPFTRKSELSINGQTVKEKEYL